MNETFEEAIAALDAYLPDGETWTDYRRTHWLSCKNGQEVWMENIGHGFVRRMDTGEVIDLRHIECPF